MRIKKYIVRTGNNYIPLNLKKLLDRLTDNPTGAWLESWKEKVLHGTRCGSGINTWINCTSHSLKIGSRNQTRLYRSAEQT